MDYVRWRDGTDLENYTQPVAVLAFTGWNDAGDAASTALRTLVEVSQAELVATVDSEPFIDYATVRPSMRLVAGQRVIDWPQVKVYATKLPGTDVLLILGPEPALRWLAFSQQIVDICHQAGSPLAISLGALLADVPHTRPVQVFGTANDTAVIERFELRRSQYEGPTGIIGVLGDSLSKSGIPVASLWSAVPGYTAQLPSPPAAVALIERACQMMGTPPPTLELTKQIEEYHEQVSMFIDEDDDLIEYVRRLEGIVDEGEVIDNTPASGIDAEANPEQLAAEVERFLRDFD